MYDELKGKIALVTGASRGYGRAIAIRLAQEGCTIIINYRRSRTEAEEVMKEIDDMGGNALAVRADVGNEDKLDAMFEWIKSEFGRLDILIANASFGIPGNLMDATSRYWDVTFDSTSKSLLLMSQHAAELMNGWGRIITVTSYGGQRVLPGYGVVGPAKGAVEALTRSLAIELAPKGIIVNGIMPGVTDTKSFRAVNNVDKVLDEAISRTATGCLCTPEDGANVTAFLCSNQAKMICGQFIIIDGGTFILG